MAATSSTSKESTESSKNIASQPPEVVVITDINSADNDDFFATLLALDLVRQGRIVLRGFIAAHHYAEDRARMLRIIIEQFCLNTGWTPGGREGREIPVIVGAGAWPRVHREDGKYTVEDVKNFNTTNPCWPKLFGHPAEGTWFQNFGKAMRAAYPDHPSWTTPVSSISSREFLESLSLSPRLSLTTSKLRIFCLAPPHDLVGLSVDALSKMDIFMMNGGFEDEKSLAAGKISVPKVGYNGGICPGVMDQFFRECVVAGIIPTIVSSGLVARNRMEISIADFQRWSHMAQSTWASSLTKVFIQDWRNCLGENKLPRGGKMLCDPLTVLMGTMESLESATRGLMVHCAINPAFVDLAGSSVNCVDYLKSINMLEVSVPTKELAANAHWIAEFDKAKLEDLPSMIEDILFAPRPGVVVAEMKAAAKHFWRLSPEIRTTIPVAFTPVSGGPRYWCVDEDMITKVYVDKLHRAILNSTADKEIKETKEAKEDVIPQCVGDCTPMPYASTDAAIVHTRKLGSKHILWGFTGSQIRGNRGARERDINDVVNSCVDEPEFLAEHKERRAIGSLVDQSMSALMEWGCTHPWRVTDLIYCLSAKGATVFGADNQLNKLLAKSIFCLNGGVQSFDQVIDETMWKSEMVTCLVVPRIPKNEGKFFNAAEFVEVVSNLPRSPLMDEKGIESILETYMVGRSLVDSKKKDAPTKPVLWERHGVVS